MNEVVQYILTGAIVALAVGYVVRCAWRLLRGKSLGEVWRVWQVFDDPCRTTRVTNQRFHRGPLMYFPRLMICQPPGTYPSAGRMRRDSANSNGTGCELATERPPACVAAARASCQGR